MAGVPLSSIVQISSKQLKPPQKIVLFSGIENKLPNKQTNPRRAWTRMPTAHRQSREAGRGVYSRNALGQLSSHSRLPQQCQLCSNRIHYSFNGESNVPLPQRHQIVDPELGRDALTVVEHQMPEMEIQQQVLDNNRISGLPRLNIRQNKIEEF